MDCNNILMQIYYTSHVLLLLLENFNRNKQWNILLQIK